LTDSLPGGDQRLADGRVQLLKSRPPLTAIASTSGGEAYWFARCRACELVTSVFLLPRSTAPLTK